MGNKKEPNTKFLPKGLTIIYEDRDLLIVSKPAGLLTVSTDSEKIKTAYASLSDYVKKGSIRSKNRIFVVHRLDRETSGVLVFAKTLEAKNNLQDNWDNTKKKYCAVTHGIWKNKSGIITSFLTENKSQIVYSTKDANLGKLSHTGYKIIQETEKFSLIEVDLLTGRKNQIRVHCSDEGHPIVGDLKYGKDNKSYLRLALHSFSISFHHPFTGKEMYFESAIPPFLSDLVGGTQDLK
jgi:RluA family pseudouridine synthase